VMPLAGTTAPARPHRPVRRWPGSAAPLLLGLALLGVGLPRPAPGQNGVAMPGDDALPPAAERDARFDPEVARRYRTILENNPEMGTIYRKLVELYGRQGDISGLVADYERLATQQPDSFPFQMILGHLQRTLGQDEAAIARYEAAGRLRPGSPLPSLAAGALAEAAQQHERARGFYDEAYRRAGSIEERRKILERQADLAFRIRDLAGARQQLDLLLRLDPADQHQAEEVARIYERNGHLDLAVQTWQGVLARVKGNPPETVRVLKELAGLQVKLGQDQQAEDSLRRALGLLRAGNWHLPEIHQQLVEIYRRRDALRTLIDEFTRTWNPKDYPQLMLLAALHDEVGQEQEAVANWRAASRLRPKEVEPRRKLVALHERKGDLDEAVAELRRLIAALPGDHRAVLDLAALHQRRGDTTLATKLLDDLARSRASDPLVLAALVDALLRHGQRDRALAVTQRLVALEPTNETHLVSLGEQLYQQGKVDRALEVWRKILDVVADPAQAWSIYGETLAGHDRVAEAVEALERAVQRSPDNLRHRKTLASVLRRAEKLAPARDVWQEILRRSTTDRQRTEAREQIVALTHELRELERATAEWRTRLAQEPTDRDAGHLLALGLMRLKRHPEAEQVWLELLQGRPGDVDALLGLESCYGRQYKLEEAIRVLEQVAPLVPQRSRELYQRLATYAVRLYRDEDAVRWAARAVAMNPDDAAALNRLGEIHYRRQDLDAAVSAYQRAIQLDPKDAKTLFRLADIYLDLGRTAEADRVLRQAIRSATDDGDVRRAARLAIQLNMAAGTLESLERDLLPLLYRVPANPTFLQILVDLYEQTSQPLQLQLRHGNPEEAAATRQRLQALAARAAKPLLEALATGDPQLVPQAVEVLAVLGTRDAAVPLGHLLDAKESPTRVRTAIALGRIGDPRAVASLGRALDDPEQEVREAACWALGRIGTPEAARLLGELLRRKEQRSGVRAMALLGLARSRQPALARPWVLRGLSDAKSLPRVAAAWGVGHLPRDPELLRALVAALEGDTGQVRQAAAASLSALGGVEAEQALLGALWSQESTLRRLAGRALGRTPHPTSSGLEESLGFVDLRGGSVKTGELVASLVQPALQASPTAAPGRSLSELSRDTLPQALGAALRQPGPARLLCLQDLDGDAEGLALGPWTPRADDPAGQRRLLEAVAAQQPLLRELAGGEADVERALALRLLGKSGDPAAGPLVVSGLQATAPAVRAAAASAAGLLGQAVDAQSLAGLAVGDPAWEVRAEAVRSLGKLAAASTGASLLQALADPFALVREETAYALGRLPALGDQAEGPLVGLLDDPLPAVRIAAVASLGKLQRRGASGPIRALTADSHPLVREAVREALARLGG